jgi:hypothetical protein
MHYCCSWFIAVWQLPLLWRGRFSDWCVFTHSVAMPNKGKRTSVFFVNCLKASLTLSRGRIVTIKAVM